MSASQSHALSSGTARVSDAARVPARSARTARAGLPARICIGVLAVCCLCGGVIAAVNLTSVNTFNQATQQLTRNLKTLDDASADLDALAAKQQQVDAQFADASSPAVLLLPQVKQSIATNAAISQELTADIAARLREQRGDTSATAANTSSANTDSADSKSHDGLTQEQRDKVDELLKANQQSTPSGSSPSSTKSDSASNTKNSGTQTPKPW
ncbi:cell surface protein [Bifidobacterium goeldii]|uniref:Cell surface protein n=1 Tax=Bifidobacterium goeldii TaxID=2306975 RepID=A0A430FK54_9BIFI|nr:DUF6466 family protein [Bifidobacterium goeldii]RSX53132.1 cell surface protein [Bifidobacterium goeldii]